MLSKNEKEKIEEAISNILRGIDIESSALILEKSVMDNYIILKGRVNILKIATRQILNFIEEYKNKGYLDVIKEKVKANEELIKLKKENDILKNHVHYKKCQKCGKEFRTKRNDAKYCNDCKKENYKEWYKNLSEEQKARRREQSKISMRKIRKERKQNDGRREESY